MTVLQAREYPQTPSPTLLVHAAPRRPSSRQPACDLIPTRENAAHWLLQPQTAAIRSAPSTRFESSILLRDSISFWAAFLHTFDVGPAKIRAEQWTRQL